MRKIVVEVPDKYCNECLLYRTWYSDSQCKRYYCCANFQCDLEADYSQIHDDHKDIFGREVEDIEHKALPCVACKSQRNEV